MAPQNKTRTVITLVPAKRGFTERGLKYTTGRDICFRGEIPVVKVGRAWYLDPRDIDAWIENKKERLA